MSAEVGLHGVRRSRRRRAVRLLVVGSAVSAGVLVAYATDTFDSQELNSVDLRFSIRGSRPPPGNVVLVEVDAATFSALPDIQWPYPRQLDAAVIDHIVRDRPRLIGFDVQFTEAPRQAHENVALAESIYGATSGGVPVILDTAGATRILGGQPRLLATIGVQPSSADFETDRDGAIRRVSFALGGLRTFATVTAGAAARRPVGRAEFGGRPAWIDYYGPTGTFPSVSFAGVLHGQVRRGFFAGKIVLVGVSDPALQDLHQTSVGPLMPGVEVQANALETILRTLPLRAAPGWGDAALILLLGMAAPLASLRLRSYEGTLPVTMLKVVGVDLLSIGRFEAGEEDTEIVLDDAEHHSYGKLVIADGRIVGAILIGRRSDGPHVTNAIKDGRDVSRLLEELERGNWDVLAAEDPVGAY